ncbi:hypothetical protein [Sulfitobacter pontiacus]|uniref:hypothetical protein n=1 Tax=Sulfitobacter pontiacus TaxID=60137 RepID=UPI00315A3B3C
MRSSGKQEIERGGFAGLFLPLLGYRYRRIALSDVGLSLAPQNSESVAFSEIASPASVAKIMGFSAVAVPLRDGGDVIVAGVKRADADDFVSLFNTAWRNHFVEQVEKVSTELRALAEVVERLKQPRRYPSACLLEPFLSRTSQVLEHLPKSIPSGVLQSEQQQMLDEVMGFQKGRKRFLAPTFQLIA